ncbi:MULTISPECIES: restriction endonuclease subunit S [Proteus]|uniref:restriction endonuclease subunit S n=1 Tax=Proteus TaxID=583 RepID=UPI0007A585B2|nr:MULTISPECIES: restriction endonuclease subunit S [Proteus]MBS3882722.1 restriction endonuclease subunit S [Proteus mirabilis]MCL8569654.1 restriction endonuclease subunit S [Proteus mirabilis]MCL8623531.1 restriction endonuclease subunit S [Proteus mirabilis]MCT8209161.1 restriction endonuclease subunit S [Proteus mirabilis]MCW9686714.1 restriction endonuclease subunit S [Proteus mirabilis]
MEQVLYKLPDGWEWKRIEEVFTITSGKNLTKKDMADEGKFSVYGGNGIAGRYNDFNLSGSNIIIGRVGALCGNVRLVNGDIWVTDNAFFIKEYKVDILKEYLAQVLSALNLGETANKAAQPVISYKGIKDLVIPYPPLDEQKRIVEKLDALLTRIDTAIEHLQESVTLADALSQNGLDVYFAELTETNPELTLSKLADFISGYAFKSGDFTSESGIKPIKITNVGVNEFSENAEEFLPASYESEYQRFAAKTNDIVIALTRPIINGGLKVCRVPESYSGALVNQRVAAITSKNKHVLDFIYLYLQSSRTKNYVLEKSKSLNQPNLSITDLKNLALPLPANDKAIAKAVADCNALISKARKSKAEISEKITMMQQLKASILDSAFKGEL